MPRDMTQELIEFATEEKVAAILEEDPDLEDWEIVNVLKLQMVEETLKSLEEKGIVMEIEEDQWYTTNKGADLVDEINNG